MAVYHEDATCGSCGGPLEGHRDAICEEGGQVARALSFVKAARKQLK